jgi:cytochrome P450
MRQVNPVRGERQFGKLTLRHGSQCFGAALARMEIRVMLDTVFA